MIFSIITASYNSEKTIKTTIESILNQANINFEYIIVDGNSKDNTISIIKSYESKFKERNIVFKWLSEPDTGVYSAWNKALKLCNGNWIVFVGSDDYFKSSNCLMDFQSHLIKADKEIINLVYGKIEHINAKYEVFDYTGKQWAMQKEKFKSIMNIGHTGSFHSKRLFEKHGNFDESFKIAGDYEFLLRELKSNENNALFVDQITVVMLEGGLSASFKNRLKLVQETKRARRNNNLNTFSKEVFFWEIKVRSLLFISNFLSLEQTLKLADFYRAIQGKKKRWLAE